MATHPIGVLSRRWKWAEKETTAPQHQDITCYQMIPCLAPRLWGRSRDNGKIHHHVRKVRCQAAQHSRVTNFCAHYHTTLSTLIYQRTREFSMVTVMVGAGPTWWLGDTEQKYQGGLHSSYTRLGATQPTISSIFFQQRKGIQNSFKLTHFWLCSANSQELNSADKCRPKLLFVTCL